MYGSQQSLDYSDLDSDSLLDGGQRRSRQSALQALGRSRRSGAKKRTSARKRTAPQIMGISHRRNHKWTW